MRPEVRTKSWLAMMLLCAMAMGAAAPEPTVMLGHSAWLGERDKPAGWERARINQTCERCHEDIAAEWRESRHQMAYTNEPFQHSLAREAADMRPFCQSCHAPEANPWAPPSNLVADVGVGCVTCHAPQGPVLAAEGTRAAPHALLRTAALSTDLACANCHEFLFPGASGRAGLLMQRTMDEHQRNAEGQTCAKCHMPDESGPRPHKSHRFPGGYKETMVKNALRIETERLSPTRIRVALTPHEVTHAVPTGDLFRRLAVEVLGDKALGNAGQTIYLARHFVRGTRMREISDDRVYSDTRPIEFDVPPGAVRIRVYYERVGHLRGDDESAAEIESRVLLKEVQVGP